MTQWQRTSTIAIAGVISLAASTVIADEYHYNNLLIGDRASGMGGAYVAVADDPAGLYYNPAGVVFSGGAGFSANANAFHRTTTRYKNVLGGNDWQRHSQILLPNFFGMIQPLGPGTAGFSYAIVDSALEDQDQKFYDTPGPGNVFDINFNSQDNTYNIGPSYAFKINNYLSVGLTLYGHYRKQDMIFNQQYQLTDPDWKIDPVTGKRTSDGSGSYLKDSTNTVNTNHWINQYITLTEYGIKPILGVMLSPIDKVSIGVTFSQTTLLRSRNDEQQSCYSTDFNGIEEDPTTLDQNGLCKYNQVTIEKKSSNFQRVFPYNVNAGIAYFASPRLLLSGSLSVYQGMYGIPKPLINYSFGTEFYINGQWAIRAGAFTNFANTPQIVEGRTGQPEHVDLFGGSFSITNFTRSTSITAGLSTSQGTGKSQMVGGQALVQETEITSITGFLSTAYSF
ncbi:MAG: hypothetical protein OEW58_01930 [Gammaproteobacteria bacterium]|nr:hypothetical protein [Gammaproteobacteria bacterium]